jgi:hypothetical protein
MCSHNLNQVSSRAEHAYPVEGNNRGSGNVQTQARAPILFTVSRM